MSVPAVPCGRQPAVLRAAGARQGSGLWFHIPVNSEPVFELEVIGGDGQREVRLSKGLRELYPAEDWARDHATLGHKVRRRKIVILEPWTDVPGPG